MLEHPRHVAKLLPMKREFYIILLIATIFGPLRAQNCPLSELEIANTGGAFLTATDQFTDADGWTHFFNCSENKIILSIRANGNDIGDLDMGLTISTGITLNYGNGALDLSNADYIDDDLWVTMNRYYRVQNAPSFNGEVDIRYYFNQTDIDDIAQGVSSTGIIVDSPDDLFMYTVTEASLHPFSTSIQADGGIFTLYDMVPGTAPDWTAGNFNDFFYGEYSVDNLTLSGSGGLLIFMDSPGDVAVSGRIAQVDGMGVQNVFVDCGDGTVTTSNSSGNYLCGPLAAGQTYTVTPNYNSFDPEGISVLDLVGIARYNAGLNTAPDSPYRIIAGDVDNSNSINNADEILLQQLILRESSTLPANFWQFVPEAFNFPNPEQPFSTFVPGSLTFPEIMASQNDQDFVAIRTGDVFMENNFPNEPPVTLDPLFYLPDLVSCGAGEEIIVPLRVEDFANVHGFQFTLEYDPTVLSYLEPVSFGLPDFGPQNIGIGGTAEGHLTFVWYTADLTSANVLADGTAIVELKFFVNGADGTSTTLSLSSVRTPIQILRENLSQANAGYELGSLSISNNSPIVLVDSEITDASCAGEADGSIDVEVANGTGNYSFKWSNGAMSEDLTGVAPGTYGLTVTDGVNCPFDAGTFTVESPAALELSTGSVQQISCPGESDGSIQLTTSGGTAPYDFIWSNGAMTEDLTGLTDGTYTLTVTDSRGCELVQNFTIDNPGEVFVSVSITDATSGTSMDGAISINDMFGGVGPYTYEWNNGASGPLLTGLAPGNYVVTITDAEMCQNIFGYVVGVLSDSSNPTQAAFGLKLQPNPVKVGGVAYLQFDNPVTQNVQLRMFDMNSRQIRDQQFVLQRGRTTHYFVAPNASGTYLVQMLTQYGGVRSLRVSVVQ